MITAKPFDDKMFEILKDRIIISGRYIDDGLRIGQISEQMAQYSINEMNKLDKNVQFIFEYGDWGGKRIHFLDLYIIITPVGIVTEMYYKPTQLFSYLKVYSAHPQTTWLSVIKGIGTNLRSHCNDGTINIHIRIQAALLMRQGYQQQQIFNEFNTIAIKSQNDILYKHTNYYNPKFLENDLFYNNFEIYDIETVPNSQFEIMNEVSSNVKLFKINDEMYKLQKNDPRMINLVVPFHSAMEKLKEMIKEWHKSLINEIPTIAAAIPLGCIRLVQKRLPNLKERLAPKYSKSKFYYGNIDCPLQCNWFSNLSCNLCKKKVHNKYKISDIHTQSTTATTKINSIDIDQPKSKHNNKIRWSKLSSDTNLSSTQPNNKTITNDNNSNKNSQLFSQKHSNQNKLIILNNCDYVNDSKHHSTQNIHNINQFMWQKAHTNIPHNLTHSYQLHELIDLMSINIIAHKTVDVNGRTKLSFTIISNPWTYNDQLTVHLNLYQINNTVLNVINNFEEQNQIQYSNTNSYSWTPHTNKYEISFTWHFWGSILDFQQKSNINFSVNDTKDMIETNIITYKLHNVKCINVADKFFLFNYIVINYKQSHKAIITNKLIAIKQNVICQTPNVIYKSTINLEPIGGPTKQYIGSTRKTIAHRAAQTNSAIRNGKIGNGMTSFCVHYCNENNITREDILTYITYETLETVKYTTYPVVDEQLLFQAERNHILSNQTCLHFDHDTSSQGLNSWDDVEQPSGMRKVAASEIKNAAFILSSSKSSKSQIKKAQQSLHKIRIERMKKDKEVYDKFDKYIEIFRSMNIELTDPRKL